MAQDPLYNLTNSTLLNVLGVVDCSKESEDCKETIRCSVTELAITYNQRLPYTFLPSINGDCIKFSDDFIYLVRYAMSTDCLLYMSPSELEMWNALVQFENTGYSNLLEGADALDDLLANLANCVINNNKNTDCSLSCEPGYLVPVKGETCEGDIIPSPNA